MRHGIVYAGEEEGGGMEMGDMMHTRDFRESRVASKRAGASKSASIVIFNPSADRRADSSRRGPESNERDDILPV
jgi:hypothetical protein